MMKVGIIGAGISGLTCGWRLSQAGIKTIIFEKESMVGGRTLYSGAVTPGKFDQRLNKLLKEFELEELSMPLKRNEIGFLTKEGRVINVEELQARLKKQFSIIEGLKLWKLFHWINSLNFDVSKPDSKIYELRKISFDKFIKRYPPKTGRVLEETACFFGESDDFNPRVISAEYGLTIIRLANELQSGRAFTFEESNILTLSNILAKKLEENGNPILTSAEVKKVEKEEGLFNLYYQKEEKEEIIKLDKIVITTPLNITKKIFPQLELETNIHYFPLKTIFVQGGFKYPKIKVLKGNPGNPANLAIAYNTIPTYQINHCLKDQKLNLKVLSEGRVTEEKIVPALPVVGPNAKVPPLKTKIEGAYLAGDFYYHPFLETAVTTAEMVAKMIIQGREK